MAATPFIANRWRPRPSRVDSGAPWARRGPVPAGRSQFEVWRWRVEVRLSSPRSDRGRDSECAADAWCAGCRAAEYRSKDLRLTCWHGTPGCCVVTNNHYLCRVEVGAIARDDALFPCHLRQTEARARPRASTWMGSSARTWVTCCRAAASWVAHPPLLRTSWVVLS